MEEEKAASGFKLPDFSNPGVAARSWADQFEKSRQHEAAVEQQRPAVEFHGTVTSAVNAQTVQEVAKVLGFGPNNLFAFLRKEGLLMKNNLPYQQYIDSDHFRVVQRQFYGRHGESQTYTRTLVTGKGLIFIQKLLSPNRFKFSA